jgi:hypothetical protein
MLDENFRLTNKSEEAFIVNRLLFELEDHIDEILSETE